MKWYLIVNNEYQGQPATRYISGFAGSTSVYLFSEDFEKGYLLIDGRYWELEEQIKQKNNKVKNIKIVRVSRDYPVKKAVENICEEEKFREVEIDSVITSYASYKKLLTFGLDVTSQDNIFEKWRAVKTDDEIRKIKKAIEISEKAFDNISSFIKPGVKESEIAARLEFEMKMLGSEKPAFDTIVSSGVRSAAPHASTTENVIGEGDPVIIDFGAVYEGYSADLTKTILMSSPSEEIRKIHKIVSEAHKIGVRTIKPGLPAKELDKAVRDYIDQYGYGDKFLHSTGHGVGMSVHESPHIGFTSEEILQKGNVITIEPGIYVPGLGGVRIETTEMVK
ncbi:MAG: M24 family metallopeptidase [Patescibacteria group bacterium]